MNLRTQPRSYALCHTGGAAMILLLAAGSVHAVDINTGNPDVTARFDNTVRINYGVRTEGVDPKVAGNPNYDESEERFKKGGSVTKRIDWLPEFDLAYKQKTGIRLSGNAWFDAAYDDHARTAPGNYNSFQDLSSVSNGALTGFAPVSVPYSRLATYNNSEYSNRVKHFYRAGAEVLDAFAFTRFELGGTDVSVKLGQHAVYWGEALFFPFQGISYSQGPLNGQKAAVTPGIEAKEVALPTPQLSLNMSATPSLSLLAQYYFKWRPNRLPEGGTFAGSGDGLFDGPDRQWTGLIVPHSLTGGANDLPLFLDRVKGQDHGNTGNFGVGLKYVAKEISDSATVGAFYREFTETQPYRIFQVMPGTTAPTPESDGAGLSAGTYRQAYANKTHMAALSYTDDIGGVSVGSDLSYRHNTSLVNSGIAADGTGPRGDMLFATVNGLMLLPPSPLWSTATLITEFAYSRLLSVTSNRDLFYGEGYAGCAGLNKNDGCATKQSLAVAVSFDPQWVEAFPGVNLGLPTFVSYGLSGNNAGQGGGFEKSASYSLGLEADVHQLYYFSLKYNDAYARPQPVNALGFYSSGNGTYMENSRGWVSLTFKTSF